MTSRAARATRWVRWLAVPWRSAVLLAALVVATAVPSLLTVVAAAWQSGAEDSIAAQVAGEADLRQSGVDIRLEVVFRSAEIERADTLLDEELRRLPASTEPHLTLYTLPGDAASPGSTRPIGTPLRIVAHPGAQDQVRVRDRADDPATGLWVSDWYADTFGLAVGDELTLEAGFVGDAAFNDVVPGLGRVETWTITAVYEAIWDEDGSTPGGYWSSLPGEVVPRYLRPVQAPTTALALVDPVALRDSGLTGFARWRTESTGLPVTLDGLEAHAKAYRATETALVAAGPIADALRDAAPGAGRNPSFDTDLHATVDTAVDAAARIDAPMRSSLALGLVLASGVLAAAGVFIVERRRQEFRLLTAEGDGWLRLGGRVAAQTILPSTLGVLLAVALGLGIARRFGPGTGWASDSVPITTVLVTTVTAVAVIGAVAGLVGERTLGTGDDRAGDRRSGWRGALAMALAAATWLWFQTGDASGGRVDLASISLPVAAFVVAGLLALTLLDLGLDRVRPPDPRRRPTTLLGLRRVQSGAVPLRLTALAIGIGFGLVVTSVTLVRTFDHAVESKLATEVAGATRLTLNGTEPTTDLVLPAGATLLNHQDTRISPGGRPTRVVAVDPTAIGAEVAWPDAFGLDAAEAAALIADTDGTFVPAIAIAGEATPDSGAFGTLQPFPYAIVARAEALPLAGEFGVTVLVSRPVVDALSERFYEDLARAENALRFAEARELAAEAEAAGEPFDIDAYLESRPALPGFVPATERFRAHIVSDLSVGELRTALPDLEPREVHSTVARRNDPDLVGVRLGFDFVRVVGAAALVVAFAALLLHVAARRRTAALSSVMARAVGLRPRAILGATVLEVGLVTAAAVAATTAISPPVLGRLATRFDPIPRTPPEVTTRFAAPAIVVIALAVVVVAAAAAALVERRDLTRSPAEVVRHGE